jgi:hypothetical protein
MTTANLQLSIDVQGPRLVLTVSNVGSTEVALWKQENSWGWPMPRVHVRTTPDGDPAFTLRPADRVWTGNLPTFHRLAPAGSVRYELRAVDLADEGLNAARWLSGQPLWVQGELRCDPSAEAAEFGVWCGGLLSDIRRLDPPHAWLGSLPETNTGTSLD